MWHESFPPYPPSLSKLGAVLDRAYMSTALRCQSSNIERRGPTHHHYRWPRNYHPHPAPVLPDTRHGLPGFFNGHSPFAYANRPWHPSYPYPCPDMASSQQYQHQTSSAAYRRHHPYPYAPRPNVASTYMQYRPRPTSSAYRLNSAIPMPAPRGSSSHTPNRWSPSEQRLHELPSTPYGRSNSRGNGRQECTPTGHSIACSQAHARNQDHAPFYTSEQPNTTSPCVQYNVASNNTFQSTDHDPSRFNMEPNGTQCFSIKSEPLTPPEMPSEECFDNNADSSIDIDSYPNDSCYSSDGVSNESHNNINNATNYVHKNYNKYEFSMTGYTMSMSMSNGATLSEERSNIDYNKLVASSANMAPRYDREAHGTSLTQFERCSPPVTTHNSEPGVSQNVSEIASVSQRTRGVDVSEGTQMPSVSQVQMNKNTKQLPTLSDTRTVTEKNGEKSNVEQNMPSTSNGNSSPEWHKWENLLKQTLAQNKPIHNNNDSKSLQKPHGRKTSKFDERYRVKRLPSFYICPACSVEYKPEEFILHLKRHGIPPFKLKKYEYVTCSICTETVQKLKHRRHMEQRHPTVVNKLCI